LHSNPYIFCIKGNSHEDGPGIRSVLFFKGCPLNCIWCHNPESKKSEPELWWEKTKCIGDGACVKVCTQKARSGCANDTVDLKHCTQCFKCAQVCPTTALSIIGKQSSVQELVKDVSQYKTFFDVSGGGVTLSGGEPLLYVKYVGELLKKLKANNIHTLIETAGLFQYEHVEKLVLENTDVIYFDIKLLDSSLHEKYCGVKNHTILENFKQLINHSLITNLNVLPRTPLIPGITDTESNIYKIIELYTELGIKEAALLPNNPMGLSKSESVCGYVNAIKDPRISTFYDNDKLQDIKDIFEAHHIKII